MLAEILSCASCGRFLRVGSKVLCHYHIRWFRKTKIAVCEDCEKKLPFDKDKDLPEFNKEDL
jgi:hypothetical protein